MDPSELGTIEIMAALGLGLVFLFALDASDAKKQLPVDLPISTPARVSGPVRPELEQALLRVILACMLTAYVLWFVARNDMTLLAGMAGWVVLAIGILASCWISPIPNVARRVVGMLADAGAITFALLVAGEAGVTFFGVYLFVIFGNGFRYGRFYLHVSQSLSLVGFSTASSGNSSSIENTVD